MLDVTMGQQRREIEQLKVELVEKDKAYLREMAIAVSRQAEIERLRKEYETAFNAGYEEAKKGFVAEVERLSAENADLQRELSDTLLGPTMVQNQRAEIDRLTAIVQQHEIWQASLVKQLVDKDAGIERLTSERDEAWAERDPYIESNVKLVAEVKRLKTTNESLEREMKIIRGAIDNPKDRAEIERLTVQFEAERSRAIHLSRRAGEAESEVERLQAERKNCPPASESEYVRRLETDIERLQAERAGDQQRLFHYEGGIERLTAQLSERAEIERWKTEIQRLLKQVADLAFAASDRTDEIERLQRQIIEDCTSHNQMLENWSIEKQRLCAEIGRLTAENARLKEIEIKYDQLISGAFI